MNSRFLSLLSLVVCLGMLPRDVQCAERIVDPAVLAQLRTQAIPEWQAAEREFPSIDVTFTFSVWSEVDKTEKLNSRQTCQLAWDPERACKLLRYQKDGVPGMSLDVYNPRYNFVVECADQKSRGNLYELHLHTQTGESADDRLPMADLYRRTLQTRSHCGGTPLPEYLNPLEFEPLEAVRYQDTGGELIRFTSRYLGAGKRRRYEGGIYTILVDPTHHYRLCGTKLEHKTGSEECRINHYDDDKIQIPKEIHASFLTNGVITDRHAYAIDLPKPCTIPDAEFYLPHYGISEAVLETLNPNPWPRWLLIGFGILTIAIGAWLVRGRRQPAS